jgi:hypothetical protein
MFHVGLWQPLKGVSDKNTPIRNPIYSKDGTQENAGTPSPHTRLNQIALNVIMEHILYAKLDVI